MILTVASLNRARALSDRSQPTANQESSHKSEPRRGLIQFCGAELFASAADA